MLGCHYTAVSIYRISYIWNVKSVGIMLVYASPTAIMIPKILVKIKLKHAVWTYISTTKMPMRKNLNSIMPLFSIQVQNCLRYIYKSYSQHNKGHSAFNTDCTVAIRKTSSIRVHCKWHGHWHKIRVLDSLQVSKAKLADVSYSYLKSRDWHFHSIIDPCLLKHSDILMVLT